MIDYVETDPSVLTLISEHVGPIHVATPVFEEVEQLDESTAATIGLRVVEPTLEQLSKAAGQGGALSFQDHLCVLVAREGGWTCVSNDGRLRQACSEEGVPVLWGLELLGALVGAGGIDGSGAEALAWRVHESNPRFVTRAIVTRFVRKLRSGE